MGKNAGLQLVVQDIIPGEKPSGSTRWTALSLFWVSLLILLLFPRPPAQAQVIPQPDTVEIHSPLPGQAIQGSFPIRVTISVAGFQDAFLSFRYESDSTGSWFELARSPIQVIDEELVIWDTTALTDGDYAIQLVVTRAGDDPLVSTIAGLRVRNYSIIETSTPAPTFTPRPDDGGYPVPEVSPSPAATAMPPTPLPPNPAEVSPARIGASVVQGIGVSLAAFTLVGLLLLIRSLTRR